MENYNDTENTKLLELPQISHFDENRIIDFKCRICGLFGHDAINSEVNLCIPCHRFGKLQSLLNKASRLALPSLLIIIFSLVTQQLTQFIVLFVVLFFLPSLILLPTIQLSIYRGIKLEGRINHAVKYGFILNRNGEIYIKYFEKCLKEYDNKESQMSKILLFNIVEYVLLENKINLEGAYELLMECFDKNEGELLEEIFDFTNILDGFRFNKGIGVLPEFWRYVVKDKDKLNIVMEILKNSIESIELASDTEKSYFFEDMYLVEDEIMKVIDENNSWNLIKEALNDFEAETPPKNIMQAYKAQADENIKKMEQEKINKQIKLNEKS
tara:strand:+ start:372 stop:1352 length:981 start_codon:yes stop_codon:yes gene_type:complete